MKKRLFLTAFLLSSAVTLPHSSLQSYRSSCGNVLPVYSHIGMERGLLPLCFGLVLQLPGFPRLPTPLPKKERECYVSGCITSCLRTNSQLSHNIHQKISYPLTGCDSQPLTGGGRDWTDCRRTAYIAQYIQPKNVVTENARPLFTVIILDSFTCV